MFEHLGLGFQTGGDHAQGFGVLVDLLHDQLALQDRILGLAVNDRQRGERQGDGQGDLRHTAAQQTGDDACGSLALIEVRHCQSSPFINSVAGRVRLVASIYRIAMNIG
jgi:hypothetical protein